eukprot:CAMPEP_0119222238 /NCGR_PEP_ID=MMETSP1327-20130426/30162_1 /TAXON_ID=38833 /ORGANISM="Micromonas pusilla, Strain RCC2306" /LENGTH=87 /DNA_ID=CAMNT_0007220439 /DNA_START=56 /DNA_END=319 /DNA_ORIENTATION=+
MSPASFFVTQHRGEPEIRQFHRCQVARNGKQKVLQLHVAVREPAGVQVSQHRRDSAARDFRLALLKRVDALRKGRAFRVSNVLNVLS